MLKASKHETRLEKRHIGHGEKSRLIEQVCTHEGNDVFSMLLLTAHTLFLRKFMHGLFFLLDFDFFWLE